MFVESLFDYGAPIVYPIYSFASIERLQKVQNKALRLALRCHAAASVDHLHAEVGELPVGFHLLLLSSQFLARSLPLASVSFPVAQLEQGRRRLKQRERERERERKRETDRQRKRDRDKEIRKKKRLTNIQTYTYLHTDLENLDLCSDKKNPGR